MPEDTNHFNLRGNRNADGSPFFMLVFLILTVSICMFLGMAISEGYSAWKGLDFQETFENLSPESTPEIRNFIRTQSMINHLSMFLIPALIFLYFFYKNKWVSYLHINKFPKLPNVLLGILLITAAFPLAQFFYWLNLQIPLPEFLIEMEESIGETVSNLLIVDEPYELFFNLLIIAVIPAIGEEFIFRGIIQKKFVAHFKNPHVAIWAAAFIFSAIHFQFQGLLTRMFLGGVLGYLYYWTGNLWVPILAHFFNNAFQIIGQYFYQKEMIDINMEEKVVEVDWMFTIVSIGVVLFLSDRIMKLNTPSSKNIAENDQQILDDFS